MWQVYSGSSVDLPSIDRAIQVGGYSVRYVGQFSGGPVEPAPEPSTFALPGSPLLIAAAARHIHRRREIRY